MYASLKKYVVFQYERTQDSFCVISTIEDKFPFFVLSGHFGTQSEAMHHILKYNRWSKRNYICLRPQTSLLHLIYFFLHYVKSGNPSLDMVQVSRVVGHSLPWPAHSRTFDIRQVKFPIFSKWPCFSPLLCHSNSHGQTRSYARLFYRTQNEAVCHILKYHRWSQRNCTFQRPLDSLLNFLC